MPDPDVAAMRRLATGDDLALNEIMRRWQQRVASFLLRMTGNHSTACDLAQETFTNLYHSRGRYREDAAFSSYLLRIAANLARNHHRWQSRHHSEPLEALENAEPASEAAGPDAALALADTAREVRHAVRQLPHDLREALVLSLYEDMSYAEIASMTECTVKAVETRIYRARQILKDRLAHLSPARDSLPG